MFNKIMSIRLNEFYQANASDKKTLDIGSRRGRNATWFPDSVSIDIDPTSDPDIVADAHHIPFPDNTFAVVVCREVLEHVNDPAQVLKEIYRVLEPGGTVLLSTRFLFPIHEAPQDRWRFTRYVLQELFNQFTDVSITDDTKPAEAIGVLLQRFAWQTEFVFANKFFKFLLLVGAEVCFRLNWLVKHQYGTVTKANVVPSAFAAGYLVVAKK